MNSCFSGVSAFLRSTSSPSNSCGCRCSSLTFNSRREEHHCGCSPASEVCRPGNSYHFRHSLWGKVAGQHRGVNSNRGHSLAVGAQRSCHLSRREVLEGVEGQVCDQVSSVPDDGRRAEGDVGGAPGFAVPQPKGQTLLGGQTPQVPVDGFQPGEQTNTLSSALTQRDKNVCWSLSSHACEELADWISSRTYWSQVSVLPLMTANTFTP